ncbi:MAG: hypothetical protein LBH79_07495 [Nitrososphaerota archaeon]|jgi:hypothetical protein|nr:hypothetical protein [Nitrososphaerota archaeon]
MNITLTLNPLQLYDDLLAQKQQNDQEHYGDHVKTFFETYGTRDEFIKKLTQNLNLPPEPKQPPTKKESASKTELR